MKRIIKSASLMVLIAAAVIFILLAADAIVPYPKF